MLGKIQSFVNFIEVNGGKKETEKEEEEKERRGREREMTCLDQEYNVRITLSKIYSYL